MPLRFHLDENIPRAIAIALRQRGFDVTTSVDAALIGSSDEQQLEFARAARRVILTHDDDFLALHRRGLSHAGIVYAVPRSRSIRQILSALILISEVMTAEEMANHVEFL